ncbi:hypothetical protein F3K24_43245 [Streptomyces sp. LBUM 1485]|nr:hypothetical protein [Streptomyces sp. LBUM 1485]
MCLGRPLVARGRHRTAAQHLVLTVIGRDGRLVEELVDELSTNRHRQRPCRRPSHALDGAGRPARRPSRGVPHALQSGGPGERGHAPGPSRLLHIAASPMGERSQSRAVAETLVTAYRRTRPHATTDVLDSGGNAFPSSARRRSGPSGRRPPGDGPTARAPWRGRRSGASSNTSTATTDTCSAYPCGNFGIPYVLKHFIDVVSQAHMLFSFDRESGYRVCSEQEGGGRLHQLGLRPGMPTEFGDDHQTPAFDGWLRWAGITDISTIQLRAQQIADDADVLRRDAHARAQEIGRRF